VVAGTGNRHAYITGYTHGYGSLTTPGPGTAGGLGTGTHGETWQYLFYGSAHDDIAVVEKMTLYWGPYVIADYSYTGDLPEGCVGVSGLGQSGVVMLTMGIPAQVEEWKFGGHADYRGGCGYPSVNEGWNVQLWKLS
jgi:hypothetical protein